MNFWSFVEQRKRHFLSRQVLHRADDALFFSYTIHQIIAPDLSTFFPYGHCLAARDDHRRLFKNY